VSLVIDTLAERAARRGDGGEPPKPPLRNAPLYKKREPIYPKLAHGRYRTIKWAVLILTLGIYYVTPWIRWARPAGLPQQAVLVDFDHGRFYFFFIQLWAQEIYFLTGLLVMAALGLFLATAMFGRLWCGYTCPQTVWTDLYIAVERLFEGDRNARMRLDKAPWTAGKLARKSGKHLVWLLIALATGGAWVFYFHDAPAHWRDLWTGQAAAVSYVWVAGLTLSTYFLAGHMREQVCTYLCPWPRIQGAMLDAWSLQTTYRYDRGEPRGAHKKSESWEGRGDCVDCTQCVVVCPMGVDIRQGPQLGCINCGLCIDACDEIMDRVGRPRGLIGFDTDAAVAARAHKQAPVYRIVRGRTIYYAVALAIVSSLMTWGLATRSTVALDVLRDRNPLYVRLKDGDVRNGYTLKLANRGVGQDVYRIGFGGPAGARVRAVGLPASLELKVPPSQIRAVRVFVTAPQASLSGTSAPAAFIVTDLSTGRAETRRTVFLSGETNGR
jgi:cytochrome c oxidase accessory protein FixG